MAVLKVEWRDSISETNLQWHTQGWGGERKRKGTRECTLSRMHARRTGAYGNESHECVPAVLLSQFGGSI